MSDELNLDEYNKTIEETEIETPDEISLSKYQLDILAELGNIGAGASSIALSKFLTRDVSMSLPKLKFVKNRRIEDIFIYDNKEEMALIILETTSPYKMYLLCFIQKANVDKLLQVLFSNVEIKNSIKDYTPIQQSLIKEVGSILNLHYIVALNKLLKTDLEVLYPIDYFDTFENLYRDFSEKVLKERQIKLEDISLSINLNIFTLKEDILFDLIILPVEDSINKIIEVLGIWAFEYCSRNNNIKYSTKLTYAI